MMDRRSFLGTLLAGLGALTIKPSAGLLWQPVSDTLELVQPGAFIGLHQITTEMLRRITTELQVTVPRCVTAGHIGDKIGAKYLNHQYNIGMIAPDEIDKYGLDVERYITPAASALAARLQRKVKGCGVLPVPTIGCRGCVVIDQNSGLALRGLYSWDPLYQFPRDNLRFDMLVAA